MRLCALLRQWSLSAFVVQGLIGTNNLADRRHFMVPTPAFEDRLVEGYRLTCKFGGKLFEANTGRSPYDVVAWHGNYVPYKVC